MKGIGHRQPVSGGHILNPFYPHGIVDVPQLINVIVRSRDGQGKGLRHAQSTRPSCHRMKAISSASSSRESKRPDLPPCPAPILVLRSEEHTSELQSLMRISYAVFCLKKKKNHNNKPTNTTTQLSENRQEKCTKPNTNTKIVNLV